MHFCYSLINLELLTTDINFRTRNSSSHFSYLKFQCFTKIKLKTKIKCPNNCSKKITKSYAPKHVVLANIKKHKERIYNNINK
jgi:hypothetical protein